MSGKRIVSNTSIIINQPVEKIWDTISDFHDLSWCPNVVSNCDAVGEISGNTTGAMRIVNDAVQERLRAYNSDVHVIGYFIQDGPPEIKDSHVGIRLNTVTEGATEVSLQVVSISENIDANTTCTNTCVAMFDDLRNTLE